MTLCIVRMSWILKTLSKLPVLWYSYDTAMIIQTYCIAVAQNHKLCCSKFFAVTKGTLMLVFFV